MDFSNTITDYFLQKIQDKSLAYQEFFCLSAIPLIISPQLLYYLWKNFYTGSSDDYWIVSDVLMSDLCHPIEHRLYKMDRDLRHVLLEKLDKQEKGTQLKRKVASFLQSYATQFISPDRTYLKKIHLFTAKSILNPNDFENDLANAISNKNLSEIDRLELLKLYYNLSSQDISSGTHKAIQLVSVPEKKPNSFTIPEYRLPPRLRTNISAKKENRTTAQERIAECKQRQLEILKLGNCDLKNLNDLPELFECTWIKELYLSNIYFEDTNTGWKDRPSTNKDKANNIHTLSNRFAQLSNLEKLVCGGWTDDNWTITDIEVIANLKNLKYLDLSSTEITDFSFLTTLDKLEILKLSRNQIEKIPQASRPIFPKLHSLYLNNNNITSLKGIEQVQSLEHLYLSNNNLNDDSITSLSTLTWIKTLDLHSSKINSLQNLTEFIVKNQHTISPSSWNQETINIKNNPLTWPPNNILTGGNQKEIRLYLASVKYTIFNKYYVTPLLKLIKQEAKIGHFQDFIRSMGIDQAYPTLKKELDELSSFPQRVSYKKLKILVKNMFRVIAKRYGLLDSLIQLIEGNKIADVFTRIEQIGINDPVLTQLRNDFVYVISKTDSFFIERLTTALQHHFMVEEEDIDQQNIYGLKNLQREQLKNALVNNLPKGKLLINLLESILGATSASIVEGLSSTEIAAQLINIAEENKWIDTQSKEMESLKDINIFYSSPPISLANDEITSPVRILMSKIQKDIELPQLDKLVEQLETIKKTVCRVVIGTDTNHNTTIGTGFLVAPNLVLTTYTIVKEVFNGNINHTNIQIQFDYPHETKTYNLEDHSTTWCLAYNNYNIDDSTKKNLGANELNYALLRLEKSLDIGFISIPKNINSSKFQDNFNEHKFVFRAAYHNSNFLLLNAMNVIRLNDPKFYYTYTQSLGSIGAPLFNMEGDWIGVHHLAIKSEGSGGVQLVALVNDWEKKGIYKLLGRKISKKRSKTGLIEIVLNEFETDRNINSLLNELSILFSSKRDAITIVSLRPNQLFIETSKRIVKKLEILESKDLEKIDSIKEIKGAGIRIIKRESKNKNLLNEWWDELVDIAVELYPQGLNDHTIWRRARGDLAALSLGNGGHADWFRAINTLKKGGGGKNITPESLLNTMKQDFPENEKVEKFLTNYNANKK